MLADDQLLIHRFHNFLALFGLCTLSSYVHEDGKIKYRVSMFKVLYSCLLLCLHVFSLFMYLMDQSKWSDSHDTVLNFIFFYMTFASKIAPITLSVTGAFFSSKYKSFLNASSDYRLTQNEVQIMKKRFIVHGVFLLAVLLAAGVRQVFTSDSPRLATTVLSFAVFPFLEKVSILRFSMMLHWVTLLHKRMNRAIGKINVDEELIAVSFATEKRTNLRFNSTVKKLEALRRRHYDLVKMSRSINAIFFLVLNYIFSIDFVMIILYIYRGLRITLMSLMYNKGNLPLAVEFFIWGFNLWISIIYTVHAGMALLSESIRTQSALRDAINNSPSREARDELAIFLQQVAQEDMSFSPFGYYRLNIKFLLSVAANLTTYLIILIQFHVLYLQAGNQ